MPKFPAPPAAGLPPRHPEDTFILDKGALLSRIYSRGGPYGTHWYAFRTFGPVTAMRFDHHEPPPHDQSRGMLYTAAGPEGTITAMAETFQAQRTIDRFEDAPWLVIFALTRQVALLDLRGRWPTRAGASMAINSGPRSRSQLWARAVYEQYADVEGLIYASSMNANRPAIALFERGAGAIPASPIFHDPLSDPALTASIRNIAHKIGYKVI